MKKTYIQPSIEEVKIETYNLLSASFQLDVDITGEGSDNMDSRLLEELLGLPSEITL